MLFETANIRQGSELPVVRHTLDNLRKRQRTTIDSDKVTRLVIQHLKETLREDHDPCLSSATYEVVGSTVEGLVVSQQDDWDILLILGKPFTPEYFTSVYEAHGRHFLKWNGKQYNGTKPKFIDANNNLCPIALRTLINNSIEKVVKGATISGLKVTKVLVWKQTVRVVLRGQKKDKHVVDIIPQIKGGTWKQVAGVEPFESLGRELQSSITSLESRGQAAILFSLFAAKGSSHLLLTTSFTLLEREFFTNNQNLRDIILLAKMILSSHHWKDRFGFKSAHLKSVVMANTASLVDLDPYGGMLALWDLVLGQLKEGHLEGFPDLQSDSMWHKTEEDCLFLRQMIEDVLITLNPSFFPNYL